MLAEDKYIFIEKTSEIQDRWFKEAKNGKISWEEACGAVNALCEVIRWAVRQPTEDETFDALTQEKKARRARA